MTLKVKICGMKDPENIREVSSLRPDFMGFIFFKHSPRYVSETFTMPVMEKSVCKTGVFVNEQVDHILEIRKKYKLDYVQLHGNESVSVCERLKTEGAGVIKVLHVDEAFDFGYTRDYEKVTDFFLFDTKGKNLGGNGVRFNWKLLYNYNQHVPFFLSGGISPENVTAIRELKGMNMVGVDVNSGVEMEPGYKNVNQVKQVIEILKSEAWITQ